MTNFLVKMKKKIYEENVPKKCQKNTMKSKLKIN